MTTLNLQVSASTDDATDRPGDAYYDDGGNVLYIGLINTRFYDGMRFQSVTVPQGATIDSATLSLRASATNSVAMAACPVAADDVDDSPTFAVGTKPSLRTPTTAQVDWTMIAWTSGTWYNSPDIKTVIQEIVDRPGWASGQDLSILILGADSGNNRQASTFDENATFAAKLEIVYMAAGATTSTSTTTTTSTTTSTSTTTTSTSTTTTTSTSTSTSTSTTTTTSTSTSTSTTMTSTSTTTTTSTSTSTSTTTTSTSTSTTTTTSTSTSTSTTTTTSTSTSTSTSTTTTIGPEGIAWGEENPLADEAAKEWTGWTDSAAGSPTIQYDADWGRIKLETTDIGHSDVIDTGNVISKTITISTDRYGTGVGVGAIYIRGQATSFAQDAGSPAWEAYTVPAAKTWRWIQVRLVGPSAG